jgi:uncharacterized protein
MLFRGLINSLTFIAAFYSLLHILSVLFHSLTLAEMFTPIETSIGALLIHLAVSTLLLNNGDILSFTAILGRDMGTWKRLENVAILLGMVVSILGAKAFIPTLAPSFVPDLKMTTTGLVAAGVFVGWGTRVCNESHSSL